LLRGGQDGAVAGLLDDDADVQCGRRRAVDLGGQVGPGARGQVA
jgi:hypothetical protein